MAKVEANSKRGEGKRRSRPELQALAHHPRQDGEFTQATYCTEEERTRQEDRQAIKSKVTSVSFFSSKKIPRFAEL
jgi:hypothetical protein